MTTTLPSPVTLPGLDADRCYAAVHSRDRRFDGQFITGVVTTGIYCRPSCPARTPLRRNVRFFRTAGAAHASGLRACRRCRPDVSPGSPEWDQRADVVGRAMRMIADGVVDRSGVAGLAARLGYSERQVHRVLVAEVGTGALRIARAERAQTARMLVETTDLSMSDIAFAAGFGSIRQFNDTLQEVYAVTPSQLRGSTVATAPGPVRSAEWGVAVPIRLPARAPADLVGVLRYLAVGAAPGLEEVCGGTYRRSLDLAHGVAVVELTPGDAVLTGRIVLEDLRDLASAVARCRALFDLDADPQAIDDALGADPLLTDAVRNRPGLRVPGAVDGRELALRTVLGQQVSLVAARTHVARLVAAAGRRLPAPIGTVTHVFPRAEDVCALGDDAFALPGSRVRALRALAAAIADDDVDLAIGADRDAAGTTLQALPGVGPWTVGYVRMRALGDPDVWMDTDLVLRRALTAIGRPGTAREIRDLATPWRPWRSYAQHHLWGLDPRFLAHQLRETR